MPIRKYKNISAEVVYTIVISVELDEEYESLDEAMDEILEEAAHEMRSPVAFTADETQLTNLCYDEFDEDSKEEGE